MYYITITQIIHLNCTVNKQKVIKTTEIICLTYISLSMLSPRSSVAFHHPPVGCDCNMAWLGKCHKLAWKLPTRVKPNWGLTKKRMPAVYRLNFEMYFYILGSHIAKLVNKRTIIFMHRVTWIPSQAIKLIYYVNIRTCCNAHYEIYIFWY